MFDDRYVQKRQTSTATPGEGCWCGCGGRVGILRPLGSARSGLFGLAVILGRVTLYGPPLGMGYVVVHVVVVAHVRYPRPAGAGRRWGIRFGEASMSMVARLVSVISVMLRMDAHVRRVWCKNHGGDVARPCPARRPSEVAPRCHRFSESCSSAVRPLVTLG